MTSLTNGTLDLVLLTTPESRRAALNATMLGAVEAVRKGAAILALMEESGDDLSSVPANMLRLLRRVNEQRMLPEVFIELSGRLRSRVAMLSLPGQRDVLDGKPVPYVIRTADGHGVDVIQVDPRKLEPAQVAQVFADGHIRDDVEQRLWLETQNNRRVSEQDEAAVKIVVDKKQGGVYVGGQFVSRRKMLELLGELG